MNVKQLSENMYVFEDEIERWGEVMPITRMILKIKEKQDGTCIAKILKSRFERPGYLNGNESHQIEELEEEVMKFKSKQKAINYMMLSAI